MIDAGQHASRVDAWLERAASGLPSEDLILLFETAFSALWVRTYTTLGDATLTAIADRVLYTASERFPFISALKIEPVRGIECGALRGQLPALQNGELRAGIRFVLVEFLTVLGNLTAEVLTPELHSELAKVSVTVATQSGAETTGNPKNPATTEDEEKAS